MKGYLENSAHSGYSETWTDEEATTLNVASWYVREREITVLKLKIPWSTQDGIDPICSNLTGQSSVVLPNLKG